MREKSFLDHTFVMADHADSPGEVLYKIDKLLAPFGFEIVTAEMADDQYHFKIEKRELLRMFTFLNK